ncbi:MAG: alpha/beta fold hydrolase [Devosia sp.]|uniref:alpha/beta hydrolase n=1 Tax=Devosia sp. TaxID=1871048 RepID=UPI001AC47C8F|nr:alpha/beta fold hydrolase [Devosia sp.]MBN9310064.1 alpha/beta fold hydrolase [Devosia sp.]MBN9317585.1 alpha/beta fold hydrolase [Devosia sp.]
MTEPALEYLEVGAGAGARRVAMLPRTGKAPGIFWLGGYRSEMTGSKATALDRFGADRGVAVTRFDYSGHGQSGGEFLDGTISRWLEEALAVFAQTEGPQVIVGSSMGGWLALLLARHMHRLGNSRVKALVLIAPAVDMTEELMLKGFSKKELKALRETGVVEQPSEYSADPYPITARLIEDGREHLMFGRGIDVGCPVTILQGGKDPDVPRDHALKLVQHLLTDPVTFTLVPDGDHRLSRPEDLELLEAAVEREIAVPPEQLALDI